MNLIELLTSVDLHAITFRRLGVQPSCAIQKFAYHKLQDTYFELVMRNRYPIDWCLHISEFQVTRWVNEPVKHQPYHRRNHGLFLKGIHNSGMFNMFF